MNQSVGGHVDLLVRDNYIVPEFDYGCGPSSGPIPETGVLELMKTVLMKKVMMNMMKMLMMTVLEMRTLKLMDMHHPFEL